MSAIDALILARAVGMKLMIDGDDLLLEASEPPPPAVLNLLSRHKAAIVTLLRPGVDGWSTDDWQVFFNERAGIAEFDGGLTRAQAEALAFACCLAQWLNRNPVRSSPGRCLGCGGDNQSHDRLLPHGIESSGHVWLHSRCWAAWYASRKVAAGAALAAMGIVLPSSRGILERTAPHMSR